MNPVVAQLEHLVAIGADLASVVDHDLLFLTAVRAARDVTGALYTSLGLVEAENIHWQSAAGKPLDDVKGYKQPIDDGLCGWVVRNARSRRTGDVTTEPDYFLQYAEMRSEVDVPLMSGDQVIGVLSAESPDVDAFTQEHEILLKIIAGYVAVALTWSHHT